MNFQVGGHPGSHSGPLAFALPLSLVLGLHVGWGSPGAGEIAEPLRVSSGSCLL